MIEINQEYFGILCVCALRYCLGRRTYMPRLVQEIVSSHFDDLSVKDLNVIAEDERFQRKMALWGDDIDWEIFYQKLREYRAERSE